MPRDWQGTVRQGANLESVFAALEPICKALEELG
jgi:hypothetical protein